MAGQSIAPLEVVAFIFGLLSVWLTQRMHIANWPAGIASLLCFAVVFLGARLYGGALLQLVMTAVAAYGWWSWARARPDAQGLRVTRTSGREAAAALVLGGLATAAAALVLASRTDSPAPWPDAAVLVFSLIAMWGQAHRRLECWLVWIGVDLVAVPLYWSRSLPLTAALYVLFLLLCIGGWFKWRRRVADGSPSPAAP